MLLQCLLLFVTVLNAAHAEQSPFCQQYLNQSISQSTDQSIDQSINQSINQFNFPRIIYPYRHQWTQSRVSPKVPDSLIDAYTRCQSINQSMMLVDESFKGKGSYFKFTNEEINQRITMYNQSINQSKDQFLSSKQQRMNRQVGIPALLKTKERHAIDGLLSMKLHNQSIAVIGSQDPWLESFLIARGARHVTTIEYNQLSINHSQITTMTPSQYRELLRNQSISQSNNQSINHLTDVRFDLIVAIACADHDGLGRYGDPLAPDGDLLTVDEWLTWLKPSYTINQSINQSVDQSNNHTVDQSINQSINQTIKTKAGSLLFSVPIGPDLLIWNMGRRYGSIRLPLILANVKVINRWGFDQSIINTPADYRKRIEAAFHVRPKKKVDLTLLHGGLIGEPMGGEEVKQDL